MKFLDTKLKVKEAEVIAQSEGWAVLSGFDTADTVQVGLHLLRVEKTFYPVVENGLQMGWAIREVRTLGKKSEQEVKISRDLPDEVRQWLMKVLG